MPAYFLHSIHKKKQKKMIRKLLKAKQSRSTCSKQMNISQQSVTAIAFKKHRHGYKHNNSLYTTDAKRWNPNKQQIKVDKISSNNNNLGSRKLLNG